MDENWALKEFDSAKLGDTRLNNRLSILADRFAKSPVSPINQACENWAETKAAYRFFKNDNVSYKEITKSHIETTTERCSEFSTVLAIQDTTYFNYTKHSETKGLGILTKNKGKYKDNNTVGLIMHSTLAVSTEGVPLGIIDQKIYSRAEQSKKKETLTKSEKEKLPIVEKESYRWLESLKNTHNKFNTKSSSNIVTVCDRESDIYDFFCVAKNLDSSVLVRANYNRKVNKKSNFSHITGEKLWSLLRSKKCKGVIKIQVPKQKNKPDRVATCEIKFCDYKLTAPNNHIDSNIQPKLKMYAIYVYEKECPADIEPIEWMLITNIPITKIEQAFEKIEWYCLRWRIETWHKIIKSGLKVEDCRLSDAERLFRYLAVMSIVAWRIFWITLVARVAPEVSCYLFLSDLEWKILFTKFKKNNEYPKNPPTTMQCVRWIAQLGGFLARKGDGDPGITHIWRGLKKFEDILEGVKIGMNICG